MVMSWMRRSENDNENYRENKNDMEHQFHIFSPYRVCPLGAHVDHQHGLVTGFAIDKGVDLWFTPRNDSLVHLESRTFEGLVDFDIAVTSQVKHKICSD